MWLSILLPQKQLISPAYSVQLLPAPKFSNLPHAYSNVEHDQAYHRNNVFLVPNAELFIYHCDIKYNWIQWITDITNQYSDKGQHCSFKNHLYFMCMSVLPACMDTYLMCVWYSWRQKV